MPTFSTKQRLKIALGGFVAFTGLLILVLVILTATGAANLESVFQSGTMIAVAAFVGVLDVFCGLILFLKDKNIQLSFSSHQEKTNDNTD